MAKKRVAKSGRRLAFKSWIGKKLETARENVVQYKHRSHIGKSETQSEGIERTRKLETAQAVFDAIREIHAEL